MYSLVSIIKFDTKYHQHYLDWHLALSLVGGHAPVDRFGKPLSTYLQKIFSYQERAVFHVKKNVGYVKATMGHFFHGLKSTRKYETRGQILVDGQFDPDKDLKSDTQGLVVLEQMEARQIRMAHRIRAYMHNRNEDSVPCRGPT